VGVQNFLQSKISCNAWIVNAGSREVLEWFSKQALPVFALFGRRVIPSLISIVQRLSELGHCRIAFLVRQRYREPQPSAHVEAFLGALKTMGVQPNRYPAQSLPLAELGRGQRWL